MSDLQTRIQEQDGFIRDILAISKCPGLSVGIINHGEIIHTAHYGFRDVDKRLPPDDNTIYRIASLTKSMTGPAVAALVEDGILDWDTPVREYLPDFRARQDEIGLKANLRDLLSNRTGLSAGDWTWGQMYDDFLLPHDDLVRTAAQVPAARPFRERFVYAAWNYGLVTEVVETVTGMTLGQFIHRQFLSPLGLSRTTLTDTFAHENVASAYALDVDGSSHKITFPAMNDGLGLAGSYGAKSSIRDVLVWYRELMKAQQDQSRSDLSRTPGSPFVQTKTVFEPHIGVVGSTEYCLGLYKTTLPGMLGIASLNTVAWLGLKHSPVVGRDARGLEVWHHTGSIPPGLSSAFLIPSTQSAVVVLSNGAGLMDQSDFIAQQLLAIVVGDRPNKNLRELAMAAKTTNVERYPKVHAKLMKGHTGKVSRPLESYEGHYWNTAATLCLTISRQGGGRLRMKVQDVPRTGFNLEPYNGDTWWWPPNRKEEMCEKGMWSFTYTTPNHHLVSFESSTGDKVDRLLWHHDPTTRKPEVFFRRDRKPTWKGYPQPKAHL